MNLKKRFDKWREDQISYEPVVVLGLNQFNKPIHEFVRVPRASKSIRVIWKIEDLIRLISRRPKYKTVDRIGFTKTKHD